LAWVLIDDSFTQHPKVAAAGPLAMALQVAGLCYCNANLTDGFIPWSAARALLSWEFIERDGRVMKIAVTSGMSGDDASSEYVIGLLLESGLWEEVAGGYTIHDYLVYQRSREQITRDRETNALRQGRFRNKERTNGVSNAVSNSPVTPAPNPNPNPNKKDSPTSSRKKSVELTAEQWDRLKDRWTTQTFRAQEFEDIVGEALGHVASKKWTDVEAGVRGWLRREAKRDGRTMPGDVPAASKSTNGLAPSFDLSTEEGRQASSEYARGRR
jgi:hypothetical protein